MQGSVCGPNNDNVVIRYDFDSVTDIDPNVPTTSAWGFAITALSLAAFGTLVLRRHSL